MKELPKVYANPVDKDLHNNKEMYYSKILEDRGKTKNMIKEIDSIFGSKDFVYKSKVEITTKSDVFVTEIVGKSGSDLLTMNGEKIPIPSIIDIKKL